MNHSIKILLSLSIVLTTIFCACEKEEVDLPDVETLGAKYIRRTTVQLDGSKIQIDTSFQTTYGFCWDTGSLPTIDNNSGSVVAGDVSGSDGIFFRSHINELTPGTTYYVRAYATNSDGTAYGMEISFTTMQASSSITFNPDLVYGTVSDIEGNEYKTIEIGTQTWMAENLRTTMYSDNTAIPLITDGGEWEDLTTPGYCWYDNDEEMYKNIYGAHYNWYAVGTGKLCPSGWHVPSDDEWKTMEIHLGMSPEDADSPASRGSDEGLKIREAGSANWDPGGNYTGNNVSGFTGLPGGFRWGYDNSIFGGDGVISFWWTSSRLLGYPSHARNRFLFNHHSMIHRDTRDLTSGINVRCLKD